MTQEKVEQTLQSILQDVAKIKARQQTDHNRIEENKALIRPLITQLERLATNFEHLISQVRGSNERMDKIVDNNEIRLKSQGERIGNVETDLENVRQSVINISDLEDRIKKIETKGAKRWESIIEKIILLAVGAIVMYFLARFGL